MDTLDKKLAELRGDPYGTADKAAERICHRSGVTEWDGAIICGSGWSTLIQALGQSGWFERVEDYEGFVPALVGGHAGLMHHVRADKRNILAFDGRTHQNEMHGVEAAVHRARVAVALNCRFLIITNACGATNLAPRSVAIVYDHIDLTPGQILLPGHFLDQQEVYSPRLIQMCLDIEPSLAANQRVFVQRLGPKIETPAEVRATVAMGGQLLGMSSGDEATAALGAADLKGRSIDILTLSAVGNWAAGLAPGPIKKFTHKEVLANVEAAMPQIERVVSRVVRQA